MKTSYKTNYSKITRSIFAATVVLFVVFSLASCARKLTFDVSPVVPAAQGTVKIKKSKNGNYLVNVKIKNLAGPKRLSPPREVYVVWMQSDRNAPKNLGMIKTSSSLLSSTMKGEMDATAITKPTGIFITAEDDGNTRYPGSQVVLRTK